ncbi:MAG: osmotically inducible protein domain protein [Chloroflexi bacterium]|nr:osmotically inducible protein domain protein [Chloroflexota bacterium]
MRAELGWDPMVTVADLDVVSSNGYVTLSGTAASAGSKYAAEGAAYRMFGVRDVTNDIVVDLAAITLRSDGAVQADVCSAIALDSRVPLDRVGVAADRGIVTLTGSVDYYYQREAAEHDAIGVAGVKDVANLIAVTPLGMLADDVADRIAQAFERNAELTDDEVSVTIEGATVTLGGTVRTWSEYGEAEAAAWRAPGVGEVVNNLLVTD